MSYIEPALQLRLYDLIVEQDCTPSYSQTWNMHREHNNGNLTFEKITDIFCVEKPNQIPTCKIPQESFEKYLSKFRSNDERTAYLLKACECYERELKRKRDRGAR